MERVEAEGRKTTTICWSKSRLRLASRSSVYVQPHPRRNDKIRCPSQILFRSGLLFFLLPRSDWFPRLTSGTAPYRSPKFHLTRPGTRVVLKPRQRLHAIRGAPEESEELAFYRRLHSYRDRDDVSHRHQNELEDDEGGDWADESTLIAMLQDGYVSTLTSRAPRSCWTRHISQ